MVHKVLVVGSQLLKLRSALHTRFNTLGATFSHMST